MEKHYEMSNGFPCGVVRSMLILGKLHFPTGKLFMDFFKIVDYIISFKIMTASVHFDKQFSYLIG